MNVVVTVSSMHKLLLHTKTAIMTPNGVVDISVFLFPSSMHSAYVLLIQIEKQEKREEEIHLAELTATAKNDEEVIAKLHKVSPTLCYHL